MMETLEELRERCDKEILVRVLPTLYDTRTKLAREVLAELRSKFREYLMESTVNFNTKLKEAASFGQPITEYDPGSRGYKDFVNLARELMGNRPIDIEPVASEKLSRPAELVQRAKQLAQLTNIQFGRNTMPQAPALEPAEEVALGGRLATLEGRMTGVAEAPASGRAGVRGADRAMATSAGDRAAPGTSSAIAANRTAERIEAFYGVKQVGREVLFNANFNEARTVQVAGDFNNWSPYATPLSSNGRLGEWCTRLPLRPGRYRYRFIVDGKWTNDPHNSYVETNEYGELNNVLEVD